MRFFQLLILLSLNTAAMAVTVTFDPAVKAGSTTLSESDLRAVIPGSDNVRSTVAVDASGTYYAEFEVINQNACNIGIMSATCPAGDWLGQDDDSYGYKSINGKKRNNGGQVTYGATFTSGDVIGVLLDNGELSWSKNGTNQGVAFTGLTGSWHFGFSSGGTSHNTEVRARFASSSWEYAPSGVVSLENLNLKPVANAGTTRGEVLASGIELDGSASSDPDSGPQSMTATWTQLFGPTVTINDATELEASFDPSVTGLYTFELEVSDGDLIDTDTVSIKVSGTGAAFSPTTFDDQTAGSSVSLSSGDLYATISGNDIALSTVPVWGGGDYYAEFMFDNRAEKSSVGIALADVAVGTPLGYTDGKSWAYRGSDGDTKHDNVAASYGDTWDEGDIIGVRLHDGDLIFYKNGVSQGVAYSGLVGFYHLAISSNSSSYTSKGWGRFSRSEWQHAPMGVLSLDEANVAPMVDAGSNQTVNAGTVVTLSGAVSDMDGWPDYPVDIAWSQVSGPTVSITNPTQAEATITATDPGTYVFQLAADDGEITITDSLSVEALDPAAALAGSPLTVDTSFNAYDWDNDANYRSQYLSEVVPGRIWASATPASGVPWLRPTSVPYQIMTTGTVTLTVVGEPNGPVTFHSNGAGVFQANDANTITVAADATTGEASVTYTSTATSGRDVILAASPLSVGRVRMIVVIE